MAQCAGGAGSVLLRAVLAQPIGWSCAQGCSRPASTHTPPLSPTPHTTTTTPAPIGRWSDPEGALPDLQHVGLSCWDRHVSYRSISVATGAAQPCGTSAPPPAYVPPLLDVTSAAIAAGLSCGSVCRVSSPAAAAG
jgi:hypothetical protein